MRFLWAVPSAKCVKVVLAEFVFFQLPEVSQVHADLEADRPVVILPLMGFCKRLALRVALDADVAGLHGIEARGVHDVGAAGAGDVIAARSMAFLAANVPLRDGFGLDVVVDRMAAVAERAGGTLHVVGGIEWHPPVGFLRDDIGAPDLDA